MVLASGDGWVTFVAFGFLGFFAGVLACGAGVGVPRGVSCGESSELISMMNPTMTLSNTVCATERSQ